MRHLQMIVVGSQFRQADLGIRAHADQIRGIELDFGAGAGARRYAIFHHQRRIHHCRHPLAGIPPAHGNFPAHNTHARNPTLGRAGIRRRGGIRAALGAQYRRSRQQKSGGREICRRADVACHHLLRRSEAIDGPDSK